MHGEAVFPAGGIGRVCNALGSPCYVAHKHVGARGAGAWYKLGIWLGLVLAVLSAGVAVIGWSRACSRVALGARPGLLDSHQIRSM